MLRFVALLFVLTILLVLLLPRPAATTEESIAKLAVADAQEKFPGAKVEVLNITKEGDNYLIKLKVVEEPESSCPKRYHITYIYPERHFVGERELMNPSCQPCQCPSEPCVLLFEEEAVAATAPYGEGKPQRVERRGNVWIVYWESGPVAITDNCQLVESGGGE